MEDGAEGRLRANYKGLGLIIRRLRANYKEVWGRWVITMELKEGGGIHKSKYGKNCSQINNTNTHV